MLNNFNVMFKCTFASEYSTFCPTASRFCMLPSIAFDHYKEKKLYALKETCLRFPCGLSTLLTVV